MEKQTINKLMEIKELYEAGILTKEEYQMQEENLINLKSASNLNGNLNCSKELEHYAS